MSDHGDAFFKHRRFGHNWTLYDDMIRIPLIVKVPRSEGIQARRIGQLVETIDVLPTLFDYLGLPIPDRSEGDSLLPLITGSAYQLQNPEILASTIDRQRHAIRMGDYKYIFNVTGPEELYNLRTDPDEQDNLAHAKRDIAKALRAKLESMVDLASGKTLETESNLRADPKMNQLLKSLGYTGDGEPEDSKSPSTQPTGP
jgi:arylsulfatase A-like enzyme